MHGVAILICEVYFFVFFLAANYLAEKESFPLRLLFSCLHVRVVVCLRSRVSSSWCHVFVCDLSLYTQVKFIRFSTGADPGFLDRWFNFTKGVDLLILTDNFSILLFFS